MFLLGPPEARHFDFGCAESGPDLEIRQSCFVNILVSILILDSFFEVYGKKRKQTNKHSSASLVWGPKFSWGGLKNGLSPGFSIEKVREGWNSRSHSMTILLCRSKKEDYTSFYFLPHFGIISVVKMLYIFALCHGILFPHALMMLSCMYLSQRRLKKGAKILRMLVPSQDTGFVELA